MELLDDGTIIWTMPNGRQFIVLPTNDLLLTLDDDELTPADDEATRPDATTSNDGATSSENDDADQADPNHGDE